MYARRLPVSVYYRNDGGIVEDKDMLNGHSGDLRDEDAAQAVHNCGVHPLDIKFNLVCLLLIEVDAEIASKVIEGPAIVHIQGHVCMRRSHRARLQRRPQATLWCNSCTTDTSSMRPLAAFAFVSSKHRKAC